MSEYINRHQAVGKIRALERRFYYRISDSFINDGIREAIDVIDDMPDADVAEIRRGKWSDISGQACVCSVCGKPQNYKQAKGWRYCPHCGAVMGCDI